MAGFMPTLQAAVAELGIHSLDPDFELNSPPAFSRVINSVGHRPHSTRGIGGYSDGSALTVHRLVVAAGTADFDAFRLPHRLRKTKSIARFSLQTAAANSAPPSLVEKT
ncbi:hypothetical protein [Rhizobium sp. TRM95796]|uniref:hypothetical protein n=1 Tax=Rhizobium sp. TRM95796 TaxID=2979862 RepID=UPI0021E99E77|nr:hypothetical protein [Rhizobium sp. TRM95796]MCV3768848.1 hypothetical protein [Rhizobium sp. TRM95796]